MAQVNLSIGGYQYVVGCRDGEQDHFIALGNTVAQKVEQARAGAGNLGEARQLLFAALLLADENSELGQKPKGASAPARAESVHLDGAAMLALVERLESLASQLENSAA
jgi:cell division protein ZapA